MIDASAISDLSLSILGGDGMTLEIANLAGIGETEEILGLELPTAGRYYALVTGTADDVQTYRLDLSGVAVPEPAASLVLFVFMLSCITRHRRSVAWILG